jgi:segregation and condensation protein B
VSRKKKQRPEAVPDEILAEGSGPVEDAPTTVDELAEAVEGLEARAAEAAEAAEELELASDDGDPVVEDVIELSDDAPDGEPIGEPGDSIEMASDPSASPDGEIGEAGEATDAGDAGEVGDVAAVLPTSAAQFDDVKLKHLVEAIVFASDKPVTMQRLRQLTRIADAHRLEQALEQLANDFADRGMALQHVSGGYQFRTNTVYSAWVQQLVAGRPVRLSRAQLETLAIVAYRQPITRPEIDEIRGVDSSATLRLLLDRSLIRVLGKREEVGRPMLYGTTGEFLDFFSLQDLRELPTLREYSELTAESRQVMSDRLGVGLESESEPASAAEPQPEPEPDLPVAAAEAAEAASPIEPE